MPRHPPYGRIDVAGADAASFVNNVAELYARHGVKTQIAAARLRNPDQIESVMRAGAHVAVMDYSVFQQLLANDLAQTWIAGFEEDWE